MSAHLCETLEPGCFRCELQRDEVDETPDPKFYWGAAARASALAAGDPDWMNVTRWPVDPDE